MERPHRVRESLKRRLPDAESRMSVLKGVRKRWAELKLKNMTFSDLLCEEMRKEWDSPISAMSAKELLEKHLRERRERPKKPVSEKEVLQAIDRLKGSAPSDKSVLDIMYALADISPYESARRLASGVVSGARGGA
ncbi:MAG: hypothetical protein AB1324_08415 [Candidatus Micrarchaeota archaeon]